MAAAVVAAATMTSHQSLSRRQMRRQQEIKEEAKKEVRPRTTPRRVLQRNSSANLIPCATDICTTRQQLRTARHLRIRQETL